MLAIKKRQYLTNLAGKRVGVILDMKTFQKMQDELDDYYCKRAYDKAKPVTDAEIKRGEFATLDDLMARRRARTQSRKAGRNGKRR